MLNILLTGASYSEHKGSAAIMISTIYSLAKVIPNARFMFCSWSPQLDIQKITQPNIYVIPYTFRLPRSVELLLSAILLKFFKIFRINLPLKHLPTIKCLDYTDIVVDISGDSFSTIYGKRTIISKGALILSAKLLKKPIVLYCQTIGPFSGRIELLFAKQFLRLVDLIIAREFITADYLKRLGLKSYVCADPAFLLKPLPKPIVLKILNKHRINCEKPIIGINLSQHIDSLCGGDSSSNRYRAVMSQLIDYLIERYNAQILIVPEYIKQKMNSYDDYYVTRKIIKLLKHKEHVTIIKGDYSPSTLKAIVGCCDIFISARFHMIIFALSMRVPSIAIAYSHKADGIMSMLGQEQYSLRYENLSIEQLMDKVEEIWFNRDRLKRELEIKMSEVRKSAFNACTLFRLFLSKLASKEQKIVD